MGSLAAPVSHSRHARGRREEKGYEGRRPEESVLYGVVQAELETFLARARRRGHPVPRFVEREFRAYLECGVLAHGFLRLHCDQCGYDRLVPFSCKGRFCPSCAGRRMADTAAHLVDRVLPEVPVRQWVLSLPFPLRYRMAYDAGLTREILNLFLRALFASLRRRARKRWGVRGGQCGAVTFVQRFGSAAANLNPHFHTLALDGVYEISRDGPTRFHPLPPPDAEEVAQVVAVTARRVALLLAARGLGPGADPDECDPLVRDEPLLATLAAASLQGRIATGPVRASACSTSVTGSNPTSSPRVTCLPSRAARTKPASASMAPWPSPPETASVSSACAGTSPAHLSPPIGSRSATTVTSATASSGAGETAPERSCSIQWRSSSGSPSRSRLRASISCATTASSPPARAGAIMPSPSAQPLQCRRAPAPGKQKQRRGRRSSRREPRNDWTTGNPEPARPRGLPQRRREGPVGHRNAPTRGFVARRPRRLSWGELLQRVFAVDAFACPRCGSRMHLLAAIESAEAIRAILGCLGLPARAPPLAPAEPEPITGDLGFDDLSILEK